MLNIKSVTAKNFQRIGAITQSVTLDRPGLTLILGHNHDAQVDNYRNGVGKTTLLQILCFAVFDKPLTEIRKDNLINKANKKGMLVCASFERDGILYRVERGRKPNLLRFFVGDKQHDGDEAQGENKHTQELIERAFGMSHLMFQHIVALNTFTDPFLKMKAADQRELIEELLGITQMSVRATAMKERIATTKDAIRCEEILIQSKAQSNERIETSIRKAKQDHQSWLDDHAQALADIRDQMSTLDNFNFEQELAIFDAIDQWASESLEINTDRKTFTQEVTALARQIKSVTDQISTTEANTLKSSQNQFKRLSDEKSKLETKSKQDYSHDRNRILAEVDRIDHSAKRLEADKSRILTEISLNQEKILSPDTDKCQTCGQDLDGTDHLAHVKEAFEAIITRLQKDIGVIDGRIKTERDEIVRLNKKVLDDETSHVAMIAAIIVQIAEIETEVEALQASILVEQELTDQTIAAAKASLDTLDVQIIEVEGQLADLDVKMLRLGPKPVSDFTDRQEVFAIRQSRDALEGQLQNEASKTSPHELLVETLGQSLQEVSYDVLNDLAVLQKHHDFLLRVLTGKDSFIRKNIVEQNLSLVNSRLAFYTQALGAPHAVKMLPDLSVDIDRMGESYDFGELSRGEMNRVNLATSWAFRDVWESMNNSVNLLMVDEVADQGMDEAGADAVAEVLNLMALKRGKSVFLISHKEGLIGRVNRTLKVHLTDGFTSFEDDAST